MSMLRSSLRLAVISALVVLVGCSKGESSPERRKVRASESELVGSGGGVVEGPDGAAVSVPSGALGGDVTIVVSALSGVRPPEGTAIVAEPLRLEPSGTAFTKGVEVTIPISPTALGGKSLDDVVVVRAEQDSDVFVPLPTRRAPSGSAVIAVTEHFSDFIAVVIEEGEEPFGACGDDICNSAETCDDCPNDCGICLGANECGNGACENFSAYGEDCATCAYDCGECGSAACGDGIVDPNESCDPALVGGEGFEVCSCVDSNPCTPDDPIMGDASTCDVICAVTASNGYPFTTCDDGLQCTVDVTVSGDPSQCDLVCTNTAYDSQSWEAFYCDDMNACTADSLVNYDPATCDTTCLHDLDGECVVPGCGNRTIDAPQEMCDDGNIDNGDGCTSDCSTIETGFVCMYPGSSCETICGDSMMVGTEQCDDGNMIDEDGCSSVCSLEPGYACPVLGSPCVVVDCSDGDIDAGEACNDRNSFSGDGCSGDCTTVEPGYDCPIAGMPCNAVCGDGMMVGLEQCDDGNTASGDGCTYPSCTWETGWTCPTPGMSCMTVCGDGYVAGTETCDEGAVIPSGGCNACQTVGGWYCPPTGGLCNPA